MGVIMPTSEREKQRAVANAERQRAKLERKMVPALSRELKRAGKRAAKMYTATNHDIAATLATLDKHFIVINNLLSKLYTLTISSVMRDALGDRPKQRRLRPGMRATKDLDGAVERLMVEWVRVRGLAKARDIVGTTRTQIINAIELGITEGVGEIATARNIQSAVGGVSRRRAIMIARTETHAASQSTSLTMAEEVQGEAGVILMKEWVAVDEPDRTRLTHQEVDGTQVSMDGAFSVGNSTLRYPGDPEGTPEEVINCRCVLVYVERS